MRALLALGIVIVFGFLGFQVADPMYDAAARSICTTYAADHGLVLVEARGTRPAEVAFGTSRTIRAGSPIPTGSTVFVDEEDRLIEPTWTYRGLRAAGWLSWALSLAAGVGLSFGPGPPHA